MSEYDSNEPPTKVDFDTKIPELKKKYYFHEEIKKSDYQTHYIVEDLEIDLDQDQEFQDNLFYYLK